MGSLVLDSRIDQVTIYREGALVERTAKLQPDEDEGFPDFVRLESLPVCLDSNSIRIQLEAEDPQQQAPIACDLKVDIVAKETEKEPVSVEEYREEIEKLQYEIEDLDREIDHANVSGSNMLNVEMEDRPRPDEATAPTPNPTDARLKLEVFLITENKKISERAKKLVEKRDKAQRRIDHLQNKINEYNAQPEVHATELKKAVQVRLRSEHTNGIPANVRVQYMVPGAQWFPTYCLHVADNPPSGDLAMQAYVVQTTGEDWMGVKLRLSTADPQTWTGLPKLNSLRIGRKQPEPAKKGWREPPQGVDALFADYDAFQESIRATTLPTPPSPMPAAEFDDIVGAEVEMDMLMDEDDFASKTQYEKEELAMPPEAMPQPCMAAPMAKRSSGGVLGALGSIAGGIAEGVGDLASGAVESVASSRMKKTSASRGAPGGVAAPKPEAPDIGAEFLAYKSLRLPYASSSTRGKLQFENDPYDGILSQYVNGVDEAYRMATTHPQTPASCVQVGSYDNFDYAYCCATPVDIPSKSKFQNIPVLRQSVDVSMSYVTVPREGTEVYRMTKVTNPLANPLLAGPVDIYLNGEFFISSNFKVIAPKGKADIGLGAEQGIKIARNTKFNEEAETGIFGSTLVLQHTITIDVVNNLKHEIELEVRERIPVKKKDDKDIEIVVHDVEPPWKDYKKPPENVRGRYAWKVKVGAGDKQQLKAGYDVKISAKNELVGGNRREV